MPDLISFSGGTSPAVQDYLKQIYLLAAHEAQPGGPKGVQTKALADRLGISPASATSMLKKLDSLGFITHTPYQGARLTEGGRNIALEVIRHHRLLETYLAQVLGVPWDEVHDEAEILEHFLSERLEERISAVLGHPTQDPHGHPIPSRELDVPPVSGRALWEVPDGSLVSVERVSDAESEALRFLASAGIKPGANLKVVERGPVSGPLFVRVEGVSSDIQALSKELAEAVWVA